MLKLLHTADIHLGARFAGLGEKGKELRQQLRTAFRGIVALAIRERVDAFLVAGDLFDSNRPARADTDLVAEQLAILARNGIPVFLIPGTHDCLEQASVYRKLDLEARCPGTTMFGGEGWEHRELPALDLTVYGRPNLSNRSTRSPLAGLGRATNTRYHVAVAHGSLWIPGNAEDDHVFRAEEVDACGMDYLALGHWHHPYQCPSKNVTAWYSGPPELVSTDQKEPGAVLVVSISDTGETIVEKEITGQRHCDEVEVDLALCPDLASLKQDIARGASPDLIRKAVLKGLRDARLRLSEVEVEELGEKFFSLRIEDCTQPRLEVIEDSAPGSSLILTRYIALLREHIKGCSGEEREIAEEALQYGVVLLRGERVL